MNTRCCVAIAAGTFALFIFAAEYGRAQDALCMDGYASLDSKFASGVTVHVGPPQSGGFAQKVCAASLRWEKQELPVVLGAAQVDVDLLGADVGLNTPVVAFKIRQAGGDATSSYRIYSLEKPPRLLRTITGAANFNAADVGLDGRVAIWTDDAGAWDGIEGLGIGSFAALPMMALRFENGKLVDAGAEFQPVFDEQIARLRAALAPADVKAFKESGGGAGSAVSTAVLQTKAAVLGLAWLYLYSGREADAWKTLEEDWPARDLDRIRGEMRARVARGMRSQLDGVSTRVPKPGEIKKTTVFDQVERAFVQNGMAFENKAVDQLPRGIRLKRPDEGGEVTQQDKEWLVLTVDSAGKVRDAAMAAPASDDILVAAAKDWKFIPAFRGGKPVACRFKLYVAPYR
ncbi:MAG TPA: hypothetical protein VKB38_09940 [Terracidiphilus sp.]|nr:hypothetical protein [Terracidiphilus sp.]